MKTKTCKKCSKEFISNKKTHTRSYCLECSPPFTRQFCGQRKGPHNDKVCPICGRTFHWIKNDVCSSCRAAVRRWQNRRQMVSLLGGKCTKCGIDDIDVLTFHHCTGKKSFNLSNNWQSLSINSLTEEVKKCQLLCFNCHIKHHAPENQKRLVLVENYYKKMGEGGLEPPRDKSQDLLRV